MSMPKSGVELLHDPGPVCVFFQCFAEEHCLRLRPEIRIHQPNIMVQLMAMEEIIDVTVHLKFQAICRVRV